MEFIDKTIKLTFLILVPYVLLEIIVFQFNIFDGFFTFIEKIFHSRQYTNIELHKIRGFAFEGSYFSLVLAFLYPFILKSFLSAKRTWNDIIMMLIFIIIILSVHSRSIIAVFLIQTLLYVFMYYKLTFKSSLPIPMLIIIVILSVMGPSIGNKIMTLLVFDSNNISNIERFYSAYYAIQIGLDNPFLGVGIGFSGKHLGLYYDDNIFRSYTAINWQQNSDTFSVPVFSLLPKVMSELGLVGLLLYLGLFISPVWKIISIHKKNEIQDNIKETGIAIIVMNIGLLICSFAVGTYYFYGYWVSLALAYTYIKKMKVNEKNIIYR